MRSLRSLSGAVPAGWTLSTLGAVAEQGGGGIQTGPFGSQLHASDYVAEGIPSIMPQNIGDGRLVLDGIARVGERDAQRLSRYRVQTGDIVYSRRGDVEKRALIREPEDGWLCGTGCLRVRLGSAGPDPAFVSHYLGDPRVRRWVVDHAVGATMPNLNTAILSQLPLLLPSRREQRAIAGVLGALDDKIELNRRMNETLEALARAKFEEFLISLTALAGRFGDIVSQQRVGIDPREAEPTTPYIALEHMPRRSIALSEWGTLDGVISGKSAFEVGSILFGKLRPYFHKVGVAPVAGACSTDIIVIEPKSPTWFSFALMQASGDALVAHADATSSGTKMPRASWRDLANYEVSLPTEEEARELDVKVRPLIDRIVHNVHESRTLAELRDALLPKLISGELRVRDAREPSRSEL